jgi:hypothetical protein
MVISNNMLNINCLVLKVSTTSIPVTQLDPSVSSVTISLSCIEVAIRQYRVLKGKSSDYPASVKVASLNPMKSSSRVDTRDIKIAGVKDREKGC